MSEYTATIKWQRDGQDFLSNKYSRGHTWVFDGGVEVPASSSPHVVPVPMSVAVNVDPEEAFVASLSSCHMLFFLAIARNRGYTVDKYTDCAIGYMAKNDQGRMAMMKVVLRPKVVFSGDLWPTTEQIDEIHQQSHDQCFIANSVKTEIITEPVT